MSVALAPHQLKVVLMHPQIAPNTGNIARLCVATGAALHLVRPLGFVLSDKNLKRSAMDYWPRLKLTVHDDADSFFAQAGHSRKWFFSSKATRSLWQTSFAADDWLVFGSETHGLSEAIRLAHHDELICIPQVEGERCLNLSTAVGIALYESLRQVTHSA